MRLRFANHRAPERPSDLSESERAQLVAAGEAYDGEALSAEERLSPDDEERSFLGFLHIWDVLDDDDGGRLVYTYWSYMVDSGAFFVGSTTAYDADIIQFYLHRPRTPALARALADALERQREELGPARFRVSPRLLGEEG